MSTLIEDRIKAGRFLYRLAWCIEFGAAFIGLALAGYFLFIQLEASEKINGDLSSNDWLLAFVSAVPFVMVAIVELTKIPFAYACYLSTSRMAKWIFGLALFILSIITFETFINGFQQYVQVQLQAVQRIHMSTARLINEKMNLEQDRKVLSGLNRETINEIHANRLVEINRWRIKREEEIKTNIEDDHIRLGGQAAKDLKEDIDRLIIQGKEDEKHFLENKNELEIRYKERAKASRSRIGENKSDLKNRILSTDAKIKSIHKKINNNKNEIRSLENKEKIDINVKVLSGNYKAEILRVNNTIQETNKRIDKKENALRATEVREFIKSERLKEIEKKYEKQRENAKEVTSHTRVAINKMIDQKKVQLEDLKTERINNTFPDMELNKKIENVDLEIKAAIESLGITTIEAQIKSLDKEERSEMKEEYAQAETEKQRIISRLQDEINEYKTELMGLKNNIISLRKKERSEMKEEYAQAETEKQRIISRLQDEINEYKTELMGLKDQRKTLEKQYEGITNGSKQRDLLSEKNNELQELIKKINEKRIQRDAKILEKRNGRKRILRSHEVELIPKNRANNLKLENNNRKYEEQKREADNKRKKDIEELEKRDSELEKIRSQISALNKNISTDEARLTEEALKTPVGQWAISIYGTATPENIKFVSLVWFGSIAIIVAWTGTLLAFASLVLHYGREKKHPYSRLSHSLRKLFIFTRKNIRKPRVKKIIVEKNVPKEVIKEIPVEKIVIQEVIKEVPVDRVVIQDVPTEVIRKEVIHVPIASDDLTILDVKKIKPGISKDQREDSSKENPEKDEK